MVTLSPLTHKIMVGIIASVVAGGIAAASNIVMSNLQTSSRIEAKVEDIATDFDRFTDIRYQADLENITKEIARVNTRIDKAID